MLVKTLQKCGLQHDFSSKNTQCKTLMKIQQMAAVPPQQFCRVLWCKQLVTLQKSIVKSMYNKVHVKVHDKSMFGKGLPVVGWGFAWLLFLHL